MRGPDPEVLAEIQRQAAEQAAAAAEADRVADIVAGADAADRVLDRADGTVPDRYVPQEEWSVADHLEHRASGRRPETDAYREHRRRALEAAGLADEAAELDDRPMTGMSVADHLDAIRRR